MSPKALVENLSIRNKIAAAFAIVLVLVAALGGSAVQRLATLDHTVSILSGNTQAATGELGEMREGLLRYRLAIARYLIAKNLTADFDTAANAALAAFQEHAGK